mmetsp:Transcript_5181/g.18431  ORF Transcript_5181/g.18431 Transcript_5181/m.18431 type:complete len:275 (+) Transcript_5181:611-1435(+)
MLRAQHKARLGALHGAEPADGGFTFRAFQRSGDVVVPCSATTSRAHPGAPRHGHRRGMFVRRVALCHRWLGRVCESVGCEDVQGTVGKAFKSLRRRFGLLAARHARGGDAGRQRDRAPGCAEHQALFAIPFAPAGRRAKVVFRLLPALRRRPLNRPLRRRDVHHRPRRLGAQLRRTGGRQPVPLEEAAQHFQRAVVAGQAAAGDDCAGRSGVRGRRGPRPRAAGQGPARPAGRGRRALGKVRTGKGQEEEDARPQQDRRAAQAQVEERHHRAVS